jgi:hypothetical protein
VAFAVSAAVFLAWLFPVVQDTASFTPSSEQVQSKRHGFERYPGQFIVESESSFHLSPEVLTRAGPVPLAALCLVPLALFAVRRRWAAFVLGGALVVLAVLLSDALFPRLVDAVSLSQARRLAGFLPLAFALAGGAAVLARALSWAVLPLALVAGLALEWAWPGDFGYRLEEGGPTLPVWIALGGSLVAIVLGLLVRSRLPTLERADWLPAAACVLFVVPMAFTSGWEKPTPIQELTPELVAALNANAQPGDVVLSDPETSYWIAAYAPVHVAVSAPTHVGDTKANRPYERVEDWEEYVRTGSFPGRYDWVVLDGLRVKTTCAPRLLSDGRYTLCASREKR